MNTFHFNRLVCQAKSMDAQSKRWKFRKRVLDMRNFFDLLWKQNSWFFCFPSFFKFRMSTQIIHRIKASRQWLSPVVHYLGWFRRKISQNDLHPWAERSSQAGAGQTKISLTGLTLALESWPNGNEFSGIPDVFINFELDKRSRKKVLGLQGKSCAHWPEGPNPWKFGAIVTTSLTKINKKNLLNLAVQSMKQFSLWLIVNPLHWVDHNGC